MFKPRWSVAFSPTSLGGKVRCAMIVAIAAALCVGAAPCAVAQDDGATRPTTLLAWEHVAPAEFFGHPKDAGLREAMDALPEALRRFAAFTASQGDEIPAPIVDAVIAAATRPMRLAVTDSGPDPDTGAPGLGAVLSIEMESERDAAAIRARVEGLFAAGAPGAELRESGRFAGMLETPMPFGLLSFGPRRDGAGAWRFEIIAGAVSDPEMAGAALPAPPEGITSLKARGKLDLAAMAPFTSMGVAMATASDPSSAPLFELLEAARLIGPGAVSFEYSRGTRDGWTVSRLRRIAPADAEAEIDGEHEALTDSHLAVIPADAVAASAGVRQFEWAWSILALVEESVPNVANAMERLRDLTGLDPLADVYDSLGPVSAVYRAESTGGGGMMSYVLAAELADRAKLLETTDKLVAAANGALASHPETPRGVRAHRWSEGGVEYAAFRFAGLPVPLEPTLAVTDGWALLCASPQAAAGAVRQATGRAGAGLVANVSFRAAMDAWPVEGTRNSIRFVDTPRIMNQGYTAITLVGAAVRNLSRDPERAGGEQTLIPPPFPQLAQDARPILSVAFWSGRDLVTEWRTDESVLVNGAGAAAASGGFGSPAAIAMGAGILLPALSEARKQAQIVKDHSQSRQIAVSAQMYAAENAGRFPDRAQTLVAEGYIDAGVLESPLGPAPDGGDDYFLRPGASVQLGGDAILGYSRSSYAAAEKVHVIFGNGRVEALAREQFEAMLRQPENRQVNWMIPGGGGGNRARPGF